MVEETGFAGRNFPCRSVR